MCPRFVLHRPVHYVKSIVSLLTTSGTFLPAIIAGSMYGSDTLSLVLKWEEMWYSQLLSRVVNLRLNPFSITKFHPQSAYELMWVSVSQLLDAFNYFPLFSFRYSVTRWKRYSNDFLFYITTPVLWRMFGTMGYNQSYCGHTISTEQDIQYCVGIQSALWMIFSTVEEYHQRSWYYVHSTDDIPQQDSIPYT